jgi:peptide/nickel transport system ATP-binding protein
MHRGRIVEQGRSSAVFEHPADAYTQALIGAIPDIDPDKPLLSHPAPELA